MSKTDKGKQERALKLIDCIENGNIEEATRLLKEGVDFSVVKLGDCPIHYAARKGRTDMLDLLLLHRDNVNRPNQNKNTPVHLATREGHMTTVQYLKGKNANLNATNDDGDTPLHAAVIIQSMDSIEKLVDLGMKVNERNKNGQTALHTAAMHGRLEAVEALLYKKANPAIKDKQDKTASDVAKTSAVSAQLKTYATLIAAKDSGVIKAQGARVNPKKVMELFLDRVDIHITSIETKEYLPFQIYCRKEKAENSDIKFESEEAEVTVSDIFRVRVTDCIEVVSLELNVPLYSVLKREQLVLKMLDKDTIELDDLVRKDGRLYVHIKLVLQPETDEVFVMFTKPRVEEIIVGGQSSVVRSKMEESFQLQVDEDTFSSETKLFLKMYENIIVTPRKKRRPQPQPKTVKTKGNEKEKTPKSKQDQSTSTTLDKKNDSKTQNQKQDSKPDKKAVTSKQPEFMPALLSDVYEINAEGSQPTRDVTVQCPALKHPDVTKNDQVIIVTADEANLTDETSLTVVESAPQLMRGNFVFTVSHFSMYVPVLKKIFTERPKDVYKQIISAKRRQQPAVIFVVVLERVDGETNSIVVVEIIESRKANARLDFWQHKGYKAQIDGESDSIVTEPNQEFLIEISGNVEIYGDDTKRKITFMPRRASYQPFRVQVRNVDEEPTAEVKLIPVKNETQENTTPELLLDDTRLSFNLPLPPKPLLSLSAIKFDPEKTDLKEPIIEYLKTQFYIYPWIDKKCEVKLRSKIEALLKEHGEIYPANVIIKNTSAFCKRTFDEWRERVFYSLIRNDGDVDTAALSLEELCVYVLTDYTPPGDKRYYVNFMIVLRGVAHLNDAFIKSTKGTKRSSTKSLPLTNTSFWKEFQVALETTDTTDTHAMDTMRIVEIQRIEKYKNTLK